MYGGKANNLLQLKKAGFNIPEFVVLKAYEQERVDSLKGQGSYFAVRSSASLEDGTIHSFAGLFITKLFVPLEEIKQAFDEVKASVHSEQVQHYCTRNKFDVSALQMNVVVQVMIDSDVSGVHFTTDPMHPYKKEAYTESVYGLGEGLVNGEITADSFHFKSSNWLSNKSDANNKLKYNDGLKYVPLEDHEKSTLSLNEAQLEEVRKLGCNLKKHFGTEQDIEFCYRDNELFLLQSRPITTIPSRKEIEEQLVVWDNSNIVESYPGITLPFTFSFILPIYEEVYKNIALLLGVPKAQVEANRDVFQTMLGHIDGRVYYQLINWYKALAMLPGYTLNKSYMEKMMGVSEPLDVPFTLKKQQSKNQSRINLLKSIFKIISINKRLPKIKSAFTEKVSSEISKYKNIDYSELSIQETWKHFEEFKTILVRQWSPPLVNDLLAMVYFGTLEKLCDKWLNNPSIHSELIIGYNEVKSVLPSKLINRIVSSAFEEGYMQTIYASNEDELWKMIQKGELKKTGELILQYIDQYGDRSVGELKLENETFTQSPERFLTILKSYKSPPQHQEKTNHIIDVDLSHLGFFKKRIFNYIRKKAAETVADRENLRFDRTFAFGTARLMLLSIAQKLKSDNIIKEDKELFYLTEQELNDYIANKLSSTTLKSKVESAKKKFGEFNPEHNLPERIYQWKGELIIDEEIEEGISDSSELKGIPCCSGQVTGKVRILNKPDEVASLNGDILVTKSTDPGWITIFESSSAILVERGSTLSHAAIVSREMKIPCIVGIKGVTKRLKDGDVITMNGLTGKIELVNG